jgi:hypothetical protein
VVVAPVRMTDQQKNIITQSASPDRNSTAYSLRSLQRGHDWSPSFVAALRFSQGPRHGGW